MTNDTVCVKTVMFYSIQTSEYLKIDTSTTHCADKLPSRGCKQIQILTVFHWIIDFLRL